MPAKQDVLAIGDSVRTDLRGATDFGLDCLFVTAGIHAEELGDRHDPESGGAEQDFRRRRDRAEGGDPAAYVVTPNTASILVLSVSALNGLTM